MKIERRGSRFFQDRTDICQRKSGFSQFPDEEKLLNVFFRKIMIAVGFVCLGCDQFLVNIIIDRPPGKTGLADRFLDSHGNLLKSVQQV